MARTANGYTPSGRLTAPKPTINPGVSTKPGVSTQPAPGDSGRKPPPTIGGPGDGNGGACCLSCAKGKTCEKECDGMKDGPDMEYWDCQGGMVAVELDGQGCPMQDKYCKIQVGPPGGPVAVGPGAAWTVTITIANFTWAKVRGLVLGAFDAAAGNADILHTLTVNSIDVQGVQNISGVVTAERYRADATGARRGTGQSYRGTIGSAGGAVTIQGVNNSLVTATITAALDVDALR